MAQRSQALMLAPELLAPIKAAQRKFSTIAKRGGGAVNWPTEFEFARQIIARNSLLQRCNPQSITDSIINVAAIGLSLNPQRKHCALVPRYDTAAGGYVCNADPMYQGLISIATETESILKVQCEVVREEDVRKGDFRYNIGTQSSLHFAPNPFFTAEQRGKIVGAFCVTTIPGDAYPQITFMRIEDIYAIRDHYSEAWKNKIKKERANPGEKVYGGPWDVSAFGENAEPEEMIKKTVLKRASKTWPKRNERVDRAIALSNQAEGVFIEPRDTDIEGEVEVEYVTRTQIEELERLIASSHVNPTKVLARFQIDSLAKLPRKEYNRCEQLLKEATLTYVLRHATPETVIFASDYGMTLEALEGKAADQQSRATLRSKKE